MQKKSVKADIEILADLPVRVEYLLLQDQFSHHKSPKKKIFDLKKKGYLQQIKRGQYFNLKSKLMTTTPYEIVANSLYFPSYVSMEWALQYYGLIMDRVVTVTSATLQRSKNFETPYAPFLYQHISKNRYPVGYVTEVKTENESFFIARPEKALMDYVSVKAKNLVIKNADDIQEFLEEDLRLHLQDFLELVSAENLKELLPFYHRNSNEHRILKWLLHRKEAKHEQPS